jgi:ribonuclease Z
MTMDIIPLGTASAIPAQGRHLSGLVVERKGEAMLFDCGEGTQLRLRDAGLKPTRLAALFITHLHGDHLYGLPGLLSTVALMQRAAPLTLAGPVGLEAMLEALPGVAPAELPFDLTVTELPEGFGAATVWETDELTVTARPLEHRVPTMGFRLEEKPRAGRLDADAARALGVTDPHDFGRLKAGEAVTTDEGTVVEPGAVLGPERRGLRFAYVTDTRPCDGGRALAEGADLVYHEATFGEEYAARAVETGHATAAEAARVAHDAGARRLLLGHFSARYDDPAPLVAEARAVFANTEAAEELRRYALDPRRVEAEAKTGSG